MIGALISEHPFLSLGVLLTLVTLLSGIDREMRTGPVIAWTMWSGAAAGSWVALSYRGMAPDSIAQVGAWVYFGAIVGSGFRPGLVTRLPRRNDEGSWLHYPNLYCITGWLGITWAGVMASPLFDPIL